MNRGWTARIAVAALLVATEASAQAVGEIKDPEWVSQPSARQASEEYPVAAMAHEKIGVAVVRCVAGADGKLNDCVLVCEAPEKKWGFGTAAMRLVRHYRMRTTLADGRSVEGGMVAVPFFFNPPGFTRLPRCDERGGG